MTIENAPDGTYDALIVDAFSSDSVPMHLITREALAIYLRKLAPGGHLVLVSHGQWINAFLQQHLPDTWEKADLYYIQSANTSLFTIGLHVTPTSRRLELLRRNDTRHLDETTRPSKRGRRAKPPQRTTLTALWS